MLLCVLDKAAIAKGSRGEKVKDYNVEKILGHNWQRVG
jgi:hypothetical protein